MQSYFARPDVDRNDRACAEWLLEYHLNEVEEWWEEHKISLVRQVVAEFLTKRIAILGNPKPFSKQDSQGRWAESTVRSVMDSYLYVGDTRKRFGDLTRQDHKVLADRYRTRASHLLVRAAMHDRIASKLRGNQTTEEKFTPDDIGRIAAEERERAA